jgi:diadenosine tetraphosphatase ApaH/serine/threonine PP2A family protein phosphatase
VRLAIISDIHANLEALEAALDAIDERGVDAIYCLGDIVGYGADPAACVERVQARCDGVVLGNHDAAVATEGDIETLPPDGQAAARHNRAQLSEAQRAYLADLPLRLEAHGCTFVHASPDEPRAWKRLDGFRITQAQFDHFDTDICFVGHTHIPAVLSNQLGVLRVRPGHRFLVNVGSVGQPRDHNPKLSFGLFDTDAFEHETVRRAYNVEQAATKIRQAGLPDRLADRLLAGR